MDPWPLLTSRDPVEVLAYQAVLREAHELANVREEAKARMAARLIAQALSGKRV